MGFWECEIKQTEKGFSIEFRGDPERMRVRREALQDLQDLRRRVRESRLRPRKTFRRICLGKRD